MLLVRDTMRLIGEIPVQAGRALLKKLALTFFFFFFFFFLVGGFWVGGSFWARYVFFFFPPPLFNMETNAQPSPERDKSVWSKDIIGLFFLGGGVF